jgi:uncharacterized oxidoreductase
MSHQSNETSLIEADSLRASIASIFTAAGCSAAEGARIARYLVEANLTGHDSHGVIRVPRYVHWLHSGTVRADRTVQTVVDAGAILVLDGDQGFGQTIGEQAIGLAIEKAREFGVAVVGLRNTGHLGRIGDWAEMAAAEGLISIHFVNTTGLGMLVAPFGGTERRMSTNPIAIGVPVPDGPPIVLDCATSLVAEGKVLVALNGGKPLPEGSLIERDGRLTADPLSIYGDVGGTQPLDQRSGTGAVRAMGEHKGSGISIMCELLAGALTGGGCSRPKHDSLENNMLSILLDPARFETENFLWPELERYVAFVRSSRVAPTHDRVQMPGEPEHDTRQQRGAEGVPLTDAVRTSLAATGRSLGLDEVAERLSPPAHQAP